MSTRLSLAFLAALTLVHGASAVMFDPCADVLPVGRGDAFPIGLALIPGANATFLSEVLKNNTGILKMCDATFQNTLISEYGARIAVFNLRVDRMHVLRLPYTSIIFDMASNLKNTPTMVAIAFRKNVYSEPAYLANASNDTSIIGAGFVVSLAMLLDFENGIVQNLLWYDLTCNACGGTKSQICINQPTIRSCATPFINCTCAGQPQLTNCTYADKAFDKCSTAINTGFTGTDRNDVVMRTGPQIKRLNAYSLTSLFYQAKDAVMSQFNAIYGNLATDWQDSVNEANAQQVDFSGGIGSGNRGSNNKLQSSPPPSPPALPPPPAPPDSPPLPPNLGG